MFIRSRLRFPSGVLCPPGMVTPQTPKPRKQEEKSVVPGGLRKKRDTEKGPARPLETSNASVKLTPEGVAKAVAQEPGCTAAHYAKQYFNQIYSLEMKMILWNLKKKGQVHLERDDDGRAIWFKEKP